MVMADVITVIKDGKVMIKSADKIIHCKSDRYGDCPICFEPMDLQINCIKHEETLICSNKEVCGHTIKLKHRIFGE
ncbi:hypothetical protein [Geobacillus phage GR1]|nr:hypothetical protein [Geobacillus phage GR1]